MNKNHFNEQLKSCLLALVDNNNEGSVCIYATDSKDYIITRVFPTGWKATEKNGEVIYFSASCYLIDYFANMCSCSELDVEYVEN